MKRILILTGAILLVFLFAGWRFVNIYPLQHVSKQFITAVAQQEDINPFTTLQINQEETKPAKVEKIRCTVSAYSPKWAKTIVAVELTLVDQTPDIGWYELELIKQDTWKVSDINKISPRATGYTRRLSQNDKETIEQLFVQYLVMVQNADYQSSIQYLAGPAREAHEKYSNQLGTEPLIKEFSNIQSKVLWNDGHYAILEFAYKVDNRNASVKAGFYKTLQGWRLVTI